MTTATADPLAAHDAAWQQQANADRAAKPNGRSSERKASSARRFVPVRFDAIKFATDRSYLVKGILPREGLVVVWGPPKCGKSFWTYDMLLHVAQAWQYRGHRVQPGSVVYVACEGERGLGARTEAYRRARLSGDAAPPFWLLTTRLDLAADADELIVDVRAAIDADHCAAIVIDTLNRSIGGSESRDEDMSRYVGAADKLREAFHAAVVVIHHCGINGERPRGHTSLTGACDAQIAVKRDAADRIIATVEHMKDGVEGEVIASRLRVVDLGEDEDGEEITSCVIEAADDEPEIHHEPRRLSPALSRALALLSQAIDTAGEVPEGNNHIPAGARCVTEDLWRRYCYEGAVSAGDQDAKRKAFKRAAERLVDLGRVGKWGESVWLA
jgi:AAA domain